MDGTEFREITHGSAAYAAALELRQTVLRTPLGQVLSAADVAGEETQRHFGLFAAEDRLIACVSAVPLDDGGVKIRQMAAAPDHRGRGCGRTLLLAAEAALFRGNFRRALLHARLEAAGFYENLGYRAVGGPFMEVGIPHVEMRKEL